MIVYDELNQNINFRISATEMIKSLQLIKEQKEQKDQEIKELKNKIHKYEQKKKAEESFYRSLSPVRKFFTGRPPNHHQAVEYMVYVKERLKQIDQIKQRIFGLDHAIQQLEEDSPKKEMALLSTIIEDVNMFRETEGL